MGTGDQLIQDLYRNSTETVGPRYGAVYISCPNFGWKVIGPTDQTRINEETVISLLDLVTISV